jgi:pimeloyl-ACP methyl ester carboxylesterase
MNGLTRALLVVAIAMTLPSCSASSSNGSPTKVDKSPTSRATTVPEVAVDLNAKGIPAFYTPPNPLPGAPAGALIRSEVLTGVPGVPAGATVYRILYHSRTLYNADIAESGYVIIPPGSAPAHGWPVIAWAHGTTGFGRLCAPSLFSDQAGVGVYLIPGLSSYLRAGFAIAATDYEGLGAPGIHGYLLGETEGRAVLDAALAARQLAQQHLSNTVIIYGHSQGGHAALFAGQLAPGYAPGLHVIGVVAAAPATDLTAIMTVALVPAGQDILAYSLPTAWTWTQTYRNLPSLSVFTALGERVAGRVVTSGCQNAEYATIMSLHLTPTALFLPGAATNKSLWADARANNPALVKTQAPMLVVQGTADRTVPVQLTDSFVKNGACPMHDTIEYFHVTGATHATVVFEAVPTIVRWMQARLRRLPAPSTCGRGGDFAVLSP